ncbi:TetR/AcrR family transcriptional regulator [Paenibacillus aurantius]|uniref:TetR/AcrR family transcriptional regulator n=1 Tax=Paenibacillus aurantius TaxID=2918900 RepID=A0AA96RGH6_9BACL|nr:TetR/AcrR family transcriptional regulator [Paenibacillus aurantius]WNQ10049.1 TetR/AcrR family transcriptional regulator [Paenibacillus aurantius]
MHDNGKRKNTREISENIIENAKCLFREHGVDQVSMHQIAQSAGIGQASLYRRYANKGDLCFELIKENFSCFTVDIRAYLAESQEKPIRDRLENVIRCAIPFLEKQGPFIEEIKKSHVETGRKSFYQSPAYMFLHETIRGLLVKGIESGELAPLDPVLAAHMVLGVLAPELYLHLRDSGHSPEDIFREGPVRFIHSLPGPVSKEGSKGKEAEKADD